MRQKKLDRKEEHYEEMKKSNALKEKEKKSEIEVLINRHTESKNKEGSLTFLENIIRWKIDINK